MQKIVIDKPYEFIAPHRGKMWTRLLGYWLPGYLKKHCGIVDVEIRGRERLAASLAARHGILLTPNHCRPFDPMIIGVMGHQLGTPMFAIASWHVFMESKFNGWLLPRLGAFSIYREGMDRESLKTATDILATAERPLVIFPEGIVTRTNDRLGGLLEGTAFIARSAAKRAAKDRSGKVVIHPIAIRYLFLGDIKKAAGGVLDLLERRLTWRRQDHLSLIDRIYKAGAAFLALKEVEYLGRPCEGTIPDRITALINRILEPIEHEWVGGRRSGSVVERVKQIRTAVLPDMVAGEIDEAERTRRWRQLADVYLVQQLSLYPGDYIMNRPTADRILETVERFEEDLTDVSRIHRPMRAILEVGEPIEVGPERKRGSDGGDVLTADLTERLQGMLDKLSALSAPMPAGA